MTGGRTFDPDWTIAPGETLKEWIEENGLTVRSTAVVCGRMDPDRMQRIVVGKQRITKDDAARLQAGTAIPARLWLNLERRYRDDLRRGKIDTTDRPASDDPLCGRLLVGQGGDTWDPTCILPAGHAGSSCRPASAGDEEEQ